MESFIKNHHLLNPKKYIPNKEDLIFCYFRTAGIPQNVLQFDDMEITLYDAGNLI